MAGSHGGPVAGLAATVGPHRVYVRFARWRDKGIWELVTAWLIKNKQKVPPARQRQVQVDSTSIRVHQHGTGAEKKRRTGGKPQARW